MTELKTNTLPETMNMNVHLFSLPNEDLLQVADHLPTIKDLLNLRLVCRRLSGVAMDAQARRMQIIYVDPSKSSIKRLSDICHSPRHAFGIKEIRYVSGLLHQPRQDLARDHAFRHTAHVERFPRWLLKETLETYEQRRTEQQGLLQDGTLSGAILDCLLLLPNLQRISIIERPPMWNDRTQAHMYNKHHSWKPYVTDRAFDSTRHRPLEEYARDRLGFIAQYETSDRHYDSLATLLGALGTVGEQYCIKSLELELDLAEYHTSMADERELAFASQNASVAATALKRITGLKLSLPHPFISYNGIGVHVSAHEFFVDHWLQFTNGLAELNMLDLTHHGRENSIVIRQIIKTLSFAHLQNFRFGAGCSWSYPDTEMPWESFEDKEAEDTDDVNSLARFLIRHSTTLKHLHVH